MRRRGIAGLPAYQNGGPFSGLMKLLGTAKDFGLDVSASLNLPWRESTTEYLLRKVKDDDIREAIRERALANAEKTGAWRRDRTEEKYHPYRIQSPDVARPVDFLTVDDLVKIEEMKRGTRMNPDAFVRGDFSMEYSDLPGGKYSREWSSEPYRRKKNVYSRAEEVMRDREELDPLIDRLQDIVRTRPDQPDIPVSYAGEWPAYLPKTLGIGREKITTLSGGDLATEATQHEFGHVIDHRNLLPGDIERDIYKEIRGDGSFVGRAIDAMGLRRRGSSEGEEFADLMGDAIDVLERSTNLGRQESQDIYREMNEAPPELGLAVKGLLTLRGYENHPWNKPFHLEEIGIRGIPFK